MRNSYTFFMSIKLSTKSFFCFVEKQPFLVNIMITFLVYKLLHSTSLIGNVLWNVSVHWVLTLKPTKQHETPHQTNPLFGLSINSTSSFVQEIWFSAQKHSHFGFYFHNNAITTFVFHSAKHNIVNAFHALYFSDCYATINVDSAWIFCWTTGSI